mgnify:FL=1
MIKRCLLVVFMFGLMSGCSTMVSQQGSAPIPLDGKFAVIPMTNLAQTPRAGDQVASILSATLRARGAENVTLILPVDDVEGLYETRERQNEAYEEAQNQGVDYVFSGTVEEWRYKTGLDGEPAVGVTLEVRNVRNNRIVWSGTAARSGWGREGLSVAGRKVLEDLVDAMPLEANR